MSLTLLIENFHQLDDGGPVSVQVPPAGLSVGRGAGMGWVLPDVSRHISGHHFDVSFDGANWWLRDVSTNGTFLQGQRYRLDGAHRLGHGDRFQVGQYVIVAMMDQPAAAPGQAISPGSLPQYGPGGAPAGAHDDPWSVGGGGGYAPVDPLPAAPSARRGPDFGEEFIAAPQGFAPAQPMAPPVVSPMPPLVPAQSGPGAAPPPYPGAVPGMAAGMMPHPAIPGAPNPAQDPASHAARPATSPPGHGAAQPAPGLARPVSHPPVAGPAADAFIRAFCNGAGLPPDLFADVPAEGLARALGESVRHVAREVMLLLQDRAAAKQFALAGERTMRSASDNNPLKFLPDPEQAIEAMFLRPRAGFQAGPAGLEDALKDLRLHQAAVFAALQPALARLLGDLAPESVEAEAETGGVRLGSNRRARAWEIYVQRWDKKSAGHDNGILDEFLSHFSAAYGDVIRRTQGGGMPVDPTPIRPQIVHSSPGTAAPLDQPPDHSPDHPVHPPGAGGGNGGRPE
ncbi:MAG: type VI secretion system-associated FHA domain protein TagH [Paracoccus sp. (in: a-proteobacteria)]|nr:type VI secretion system-associated FHA domain protein TagH [Paracoccus sp. (in: a-proteobacteria)]